MKFGKLLFIWFVMLFLVTTAPVLGQQAEPTATAAATAVESTFLLPAGSETPTKEPELPTPTGENSLESATPTITFIPSWTETVEPSNMATPNATATTRPTVTPKPPVPACSTADVFENQILISSGKSALPTLPFEYTLVSQSLDINGDQYTVIQVGEVIYCSVLDALQNVPGIQYAEPNYSFSLLETYPNDAYFDDQYYLNNILAPQAWDYVTGSPAVTIAVIDTGVDAGNPDLGSKLIDGYDFVENDAVPQDENGHGTFVAGVAAASTNNGSGVAGVSWGAQIMPLRVLDRYGNGSYASAASAILWAADHGARVINMSIGGSKYSQVLADAVDSAMQRGVVMVAATGNTGSPFVLYPAALPGVIAVGATDAYNNLAGFSNNGPQVDVVAPGVSIIGLGLDAPFTISSGTSMASPQVAGYAALLFSVPGVAYSSQVEEIILSTAKDLGAGGFDSYYGFGLIQVGPGILSALGLGTVTPTRTVQHHEETANPTSTPTVIWIPPVVYHTPSPNPFFGGINANEPTPTPGEIYMLGGVSSPTPTGTPEGSSAFPSSSGARNGQEGLSGWIWLSIGLLYILAGTGLFFYIRSRY